MSTLRLKRPMPQWRYESMWWLPKLHRASRVARQARHLTRAYAQGGVKWL